MVDPVGDRFQGCDQPCDLGQQRFVALDRIREPQDPALSLGALTAGALNHPPFGVELGGQLRSPSRLRPLVRCRAPSLDQRFEALLFLRRFGAICRHRRLALGLAL